MKNKYDEIRSFYDSEVSEVIDSLKKNQRFHKLLSLLSRDSIGTKEMASKFRNLFGDISSIEEFQLHLEPLVQKMIKNSTKGFSVSGLEYLSNKPTLFISNHRDIALDPLFLNLTLFNRGIKTSNIAVGDNLLDGDYFEQLMKLNKSFVVHRNTSGFKQTLKVISRLSAYINKILTEDNGSIWIAQKEGRAIDGWDKTDASVLKMLYFSSKKKISLMEWVQKINLIPLSISYEYDPLDIIKSRELSAENKIIGEDVAVSHQDQLFLGILGDKGRVHLSIGKNIEIQINTIEELVKNIDYQIINNYKLWPSNFCAAKNLQMQSLIEINLEKEYTPEFEKFFLNRFKDLKIKDIHKILEIYSAPILNKGKLGLI